MDKIIISLDDLSDRQREIAEVIGIENYIKSFQNALAVKILFIYKNILRLSRVCVIRKFVKNIMMDIIFQSLPKFIIFQKDIFISCAIIKLERNTFLEIIPL